MSNMSMQIEWKSVERARALALACRLDRQLYEAAETASRPEARLAGSLRNELGHAVRSQATTAELFGVVATVHRQLAFLPKPELPTGLRVFLREVFGPRWDAEVVVAPGSAARWPRVGQDPQTTTAAPAGASAAAERNGRTVAQPVAVIPQAELHNPLMWPLIGLQAAAYDGWHDAEERIAQRTGSGLLFAKAEALLETDSASGQQLWEQGRKAMDASLEGAGAAELASSLADGVLISAHRRAAAEEADGVYGRLAAAHDEPASAADILHAGWLHWYGRALDQLLALDAAVGATTGADGRAHGGDDSGENRGEDGWSNMCRFVNGVDDLLCRSLDVAAVHRFYATEGAMA